MDKNNINNILAIQKVSQQFLFKQRLLLSKQLDPRKIRSLNEDKNKQRYLSQRFKKFRYGSINWNDRLYFSIETILELLQQVENRGRLQSVPEVVRPRRSLEDLLRVSTQSLRGLCLLLDHNEFRRSGERFSLIIRPSRPSNHLSQ